jgi:hypothetical protein
MTSESCQWLLKKISFGLNKVTWVIRSFDHLQSEPQWTLKTNIVGTFSGFPRILTRLSRVSRTKVITIWKQQGNGGLSRKLEQVWGRSQARISFWTELLGQFGQNEVRLMIPFRLGLKFKAAKKNCSVLYFWTESVLSERLSLKLMLTSKDTDLGEDYYTRVVDNFDTFPASINTPIYDKWFRSNDLWKSRGAAGISVWTKESDLSTSEFELKESKLCGNSE